MTRSVSNARARSAALRRLETELSRLSDLHRSLGSDGDAKLAAKRELGFGKKGLDVLRETVFVRLVSALEVFLVDSIRELFRSRKDLFRRDDQVRVSIDELLTVRSHTPFLSTFLRDELRRLQNRGLASMASYFSRHFGIEIAEWDCFDTLLEVETRRHLLVHRLGRTDEFYREKYQFKNKIVRVSGTYLDDSIALVRDFARRVAPQAEELIAAGDQVVQKRAETQHRVRWVLSDFDDIGHRAVQPSKTFIVGDQLTAVQDLEVERRLLNGCLSITVAGERAVVRHFGVILKRLARRGHLVIASKVVLHPGPPRRRFEIVCSLPDEMIAEIARGLPFGPLHLSDEKRLAQAHSTSRSQIGKALRIIRADPELRELVGTDTKSPESHGV